jgi:hypothetical protein
LFFALILARWRLVLPRLVLRGRLAVVRYMGLLARQRTPRPGWRAGVARTVREPSSSARARFIRHNRAQFKLLRPPAHTLVLSRPHAPLNEGAVLS